MNEPANVGITEYLNIKQTEPSTKKYIVITRSTYENIYLVDDAGDEKTAIELVLDLPKNDNMIQRHKGETAIRTVAVLNSFTLDDLSQWVRHHD